MKQKIIEILKSVQTTRTDGVHHVIITGIFPVQYEDVASRIEGLYVCPKCGNTGRCEPRTLSDPDGQECDCIEALGEDELVKFAEWWMEQGYISCIVEDEVKKYINTEPPKK